MATYYVDPVSGNDTHAGTSFATAFATLAHAESVAAAGDVIHPCATGNHVIGAALALAASGNSTTGPISYVGANASGVVDGTQPTITTSVNNADMIQLNGKSYRLFQYLTLQSTASTPGHGIAASTANSSFIAVKDFTLKGLKDGIYAGNLEGTEFNVYALELTDGYIANCTRDGVRVAAPTLVDSLGIYNCAGRGLDIPTSSSNETAPTVEVSRTIISACGIGLTLSNQAGAAGPVLTLQSSTIANNVGDGIQWQTAAGNNAVVIHENNLVYGNGGYGGNLTDGASLVALNRYNAYGANGTAAHNANLPVGTGEITLTASPFAGGVTINSLATLRQYYALNSTAGGGALCRGAGYPAALDVGALQHTEIVNPPATPTLTVTVDNTQQQVSYTVSGSTPGSSNAIQTAPISNDGAQTWTVELSNTGDFTALVNPHNTGRYVATVVSTLGGLAALQPAAPVDFTVQVPVTTLEEGLFTYLSNLAGIAALVATRIYPAPAPEDAVYPLLIYQRISTVRIRSLTAPAQLAEARMQINAEATTYAAAKQLADELRNALDGFQGSFGTIAISGCFLEDDADAPDVSPELLANRLYRVRLDFLIAYQETLPTYQ